MAFILSALWSRRIRGWWKLPVGRDCGGNWFLFWWVGPCSVKTLIQFSIDGQGRVPSLLFDLRSNSGGGNEENGISFKRSCTCAASLSAPNPAADHTNPWLQQRRLDTHRQVWVRGRQLTKGSDKGRVKKSPDKVTMSRVSMSIFNTMYLWRANQRLPTSEEAGFYDVALKSNKLANSKNLLGGRINIEGWYNILSNMPAFSHTEHRRYSRKQESVTYAEKTKLKSR